MSSITLTTVAQPASLTPLQPQVSNLTLRFRSSSMAVEPSPEDLQFFAEREWLTEQSEKTYSEWDDPLSRNIHGWILSVLRAHENTRSVTPEVEAQVKDQISQLVNTILVDAPHAEPRPHAFAQALLTRIARLPERLKPSTRTPALSVPVSQAGSLIPAAGVGAGEVAAATPESAVASASLSDAGKLIAYQFLARSAASINRSRQFTQFAAEEIPAQQNLEERIRAATAAQVRGSQQEVKEHEQKMIGQMNLIDEAHRKKEGFLKGQIADGQLRLASVSSRLSQAEAALHRQSSEIAALREANAQRIQEIQFIRDNSGGSDGCVIL